MVKVKSQNTFGDINIYQVKKYKSLGIYRTDDENVSEKAKF